MQIFSIYSALFTPLNVLPTTTSGITLWNGESQVVGAMGKAYIVDSFFGATPVSQAVSTQMSIFQMVNRGAIVQPTFSTPLTPVGQNGQTYPASGKALAGAAVTVSNDGWFPWGQSVVIPNSAHANTVIDEPVVHGEIIIYPGFAISLQMLVANAPVASSVQLGITWYETSVEEARALSS